MFNLNNLTIAWDFFKLIFTELILLFIIISFVVALLQRYISKDTIKNVLSKPHQRMQNIIGAALGAVTPFCSCSTIPILVGLSFDSFYQPKIVIGIAWHCVGNTAFLSTFELTFRINKLPEYLGIRSPCYMGEKPYICAVF